MDPKVIAIIIISFGFLLGLGTGALIYGRIAEEWIKREGEYRVKSSHMIYRWLCIKTWLGCAPEKPSKDFNWYDFYLNESPQGPKRYIHISQVWRQKDEYEEIAAYLEEHQKDWEDYAEWAIQSGIFSLEFAASIL